MMISGRPPLKGYASEAKLDNILTTLQASAGTLVLITEIDSTSTANCVYIGSAPMGSATSSAVWQVCKVNKTTSPVTILYAGTGVFDQVFSNRTSLTYS